MNWYCGGRLLSLWHSAGYLMLRSTLVRCESRWWSSGVVGVELWLVKDWKGLGRESNRYSQHNYQV